MFMAPSPRKQSFQCAARAAVPVRQQGRPDPGAAGLAAATVRDWLDVLAGAQADGVRETPDGLARRTAVLAVLRGGLLDLLATGDVERTTAAVHRLLPA